MRKTDYGFIGSGWCSRCGLVDIGPCRAESVDEVKRALIIDHANFAPHKCRGPINISIHHQNAELLDPPVFEGEIAAHYQDTLQKEISLVMGIRL